MTKPVDDTELVIKVDPEQGFQTIENLGVSGAWRAQEVGGWQAGNRQRVIDLLFNEQEGIGLSAYRYNIGAGGGDEIIDQWRKAESFETGPMIYDWSRDANAVRILKMVRAAGINQFIAFANSPPPRLTRSCMVGGRTDGASNLGIRQEAAYARYLVDIVSHLQQEEGIPISWVSPVNEPQWDWNPSKGQEGCHYSPDEVAVLVTALQKAIQNEGMDLKILAPESGQWAGSQKYLEALMDQANGFPKLDVLAIHSYWSTSKDKELTSQMIRQKYPEVRLWMTEWTEMQNGRDEGMDSAITLAKTIHDDITLAGVSAWQYWIAVSKYEYRDGLLYVNPGSQIVTETKRLWALGNFSRFIRPGAQLISAQLNSDRLQVSAYQTPDRNSIIIVVINSQPDAQPARLEIPGDWFALEGFETSQKNDLKQVYQGTLPDSYTFPSLSVTTLIIKP